MASLPVLASELPEVLVNGTHLYGSAFLGRDNVATLYSIDPTDGGYTAIGPIGYSRVGALELAGDGGLYGTGYQLDGGVHVLLAINPSTGAGTEIGPTGIESLDQRNVTDLTFGADGALYAWLDPGDRFGTINTTTGAFTQLSNPSVSGCCGQALASAPDGGMFTFTESEVNQLDPTTGSATFIRRLVYGAPSVDFPRANAADYVGEVPLVSIRDGFEDDPQSASSLGVVCPSGFVVNYASTINGLDGLVAPPGVVLPTFGTGDLSLSITDAPDPVAPGSNITYTLTVTNIGMTSVDGRVAAALPINTSFVSATPSAGSCSSAPEGENAPARVFCDLGPIATSDNETVDIVVTAGSGSGFGLNATAGSNDCDPTPSNNVDFESTSVERADLSITKVSQRRNAKSGSTLTYDITVTNNGPNTALNAVLTDTLPLGVSFASAPTCSHSAGVVTCNLGNLGAGSTVSRTITVNVNLGGKNTLNNHVSVTSDTFDPDTSNNTASLSNKVVGKPN